LFLSATDHDCECEQTNSQHIDHEKTNANAGARLLFLGVSGTAALEDEHVTGIEKIKFQNAVQALYPPKGIAILQCHLQIVFTFDFSFFLSFFLPFCLLEILNGEFCVIN